MGAFARTKLTKLHTFCKRNQSRHKLSSHKLSDWMCAYARTCFPNAIPHLDRVNITFDDIMMPIGIWQNAWDSSGIVSQIYKIIASEKLGFFVNEEIGPASELILGKLAGCSHQGFAITGRIQDCAFIIFQSIYIYVYIYLCFCMKHIVFYIWKF